MTESIHPLRDQPGQVDIKQSSGGMITDHTPSKEWVEIYVPIYQPWVTIPKDGPEPAGVA